MLVLSRKEGERIVIGRDIMITVVESRGNRVRLGITAPQGTPVHRQEIFERLARTEPGSADDGYHERSPFFVESS